MDSKKHGHLALSCADDHGREGFFFLAKEVTLHTLISSLKELKVQFDKDFANQKSGWDRYYSQPIKKYLANLGHQLYYG